MTTSQIPRWLPPAAAAAALVGIVGVSMLPIARCAGGCFIDYFEIHDRQTAHFEIPDARLNASILGWVDHALATNPGGLFDTNAFHPAPNTLAGSEHMLGVALQLLPLGLFSDSSVLLHQAAVILSFGILALTTFALVRWATGSTWAAFLAGAAAPFMPWRFSELGHLQLLSVQWIPLVWLLTLRVLCEESRRRHAVCLAAVLCVQMASSFYLAYLTLFSMGILTAAAWVIARPPRTAFLRFGGALAIPCALVATTAIPYLTRFSAYRYSDASTTEFATTPALVLGLLTPPMALVADAAGIAPLTYHVPWIFLLGAVLALAWLRPREPEPAADLRGRILVWALLLAVGGALVLMLGRDIDVGGTSIPLPSHWLAQFVPGFSQMRAEFRWGIIIGVAAPVLAGIGFAGVERRFADIVGGRPAATWALRGVAGVLVALNVSWFQLPARDAWSDGGDVLAAHRSLATLPPGPVVEIPWALHRVAIATNGSRYMLASGENWHPLLNGYTAYIPASHHFLQRLAQSLPDPRTIATLSRLTGLRWIVVHPARLGPHLRSHWAAAEQKGWLQAEVAGPGFRIYEVAATPDSGSWRAALLAAEPGGTTMTGLSRSRLTAGGAAGTLRVETPDQMAYEHLSGIPEFVVATLENPDDAPWPGLDIHTEGLVQLRYRFMDEAGAVVHEATASFDRDLPARLKSVARVLIEPPARSGRYRVRFDVVQRIGDGLLELNLPATTAEIEVTKRLRLPRTPDA